MNFAAHIKDGQIRVEAPVRFAAHLRKLGGGEIIVSIEKPKRGRSVAQNAYYWGVVIKMLADNWGWEDHDELHDALKYKFLRLEAEPEAGRLLESVRSTAKMTTAEFEEYVDRVRTWAAVEHNVHIPLPNEIDAAVAWGAEAA